MINHLRIHMNHKYFTLALFLSALCSSGSAQQVIAEDVSPGDTVLSDTDPLPIEQRGGEFTLYGTTGAVSLSDFRGKVVAIYFGYSQCPDVCPTNLSILTAAMKRLNKQELDKFQAIFISVDPGRDSPERLAQYTAFFHTDMIGISGTPADLDPVVVQYGAFYEVVSYSNSEMLYGIDHTSETYIVGKDGKIKHVLPHASPRDAVLDAIRDALQ